MIPRFTTLAFLLALSAAAIPAAAQPAGPPPPPRDRDADGRTGVALFVSPCGQPFRASTTHPDPVAAWFEQLDQNHDGVLDPAEFRAEAQAFFRVLDQDHDGVIAGPEVARYEQELAPDVYAETRLMSDGEGRPKLLLIQLGGGDMGGMGGMGGPAGGGGGGPGGRPGGGPPRGGSGERPAGGAMQGAAAFNFLREPEPVSGSDGDFNGRIRLDEFVAASDRRFKLLDLDDDGKLAMADLPRIGRGPPQGGRGPGRPRRSGA